MDPHGNRSAEWYQGTLFYECAYFGDTGSNEPVGMLVFYVKEKVLEDMYSFFSVRRVFD